MSWFKRTYNLHDLTEGYLPTVTDAILASTPNPTPGEKALAKCEAKCVIAKNFTSVAEELVSKLYITGVAVTGAVCLGLGAILNSGQAFGPIAASVTIGAIALAGTWGAILSFTDAIRNQTSLDEGFEPNPEAQGSYGVHKKVANRLDNFISLKLRTAHPTNG